MIKHRDSSNGGSSYRSGGDSGRRRSSDSIESDISKNTNENEFTLTCTKA